MRADPRHVAVRLQQKRSRIVILLVVFFLVLIVGTYELLSIFKMVAGGYIATFVLPPRQLVVTVEDVTYSRGDMVKLLRVRQKGVELLGRQFNAGTDIYQALLLIRENEIIAQAAPRFGITVSDREIDDVIRRRFAPSESQAAGIASDQIEREFKERYKAYLNAIQISDEEHRQLLRRAILRERFRQFIGERVPTVAEQVRVHRLVMLPEDEIDIMRVRFKDEVGDSKDPAHLQEAFKQIVREFSRDTPEMVRRGGDLGWVPRGAIQDHERRFFDLESGELSEATQNDIPRQLLFFMVSERAEARAIDPQNRDVLKTRALQDWINDEIENHDTRLVFNSEIYEWMVKQLGLTSTEPRNPLQLVPSGFENRG